MPSFSFIKSTQYNVLIATESSVIYNVASTTLARMFNEAIYRQQPFQLHQHNFEERIIQK